MMSYKAKNYGFSLTEVLLAVGVLAMGMLFVGGMFPVGIRFSEIATEQTTAAVVADEAFAKLRLYALDDPTTPADNIDFVKLSQTSLAYFNETDPTLRAFPLSVNMDANDFAYPSTGTPWREKQYFWSALCRHVGGRLVQVTIFVNRKIGGASTYWKWDKSIPGLVPWPTPQPVPVEVAQVAPNELKIIGDKTFINDGSIIVDDENGRIYRVSERYAGLKDNILRLNSNWEPGITSPDLVWVVPPAINGSRNPCIVVYQKVMRF